MLPIFNLPISHSFMVHGMRNRQKRKRRDETRVDTALRQSQMNTLKTSEKKNKSADGIYRIHIQTSMTRIIPAVRFICSFNSNSSAYRMKKFNISNGASIWMFCIRNKTINKIPWIQWRGSIARHWISSSNFHRSR